MAREENASLTVYHLQKIKTVSLVKTDKHSQSSLPDTKNLLWLQWSYSCPSAGEYGPSFIKYLNTQRANFVAKNHSGPDLEICHLVQVVNLLHFTVPGQHLNTEWQKTKGYLAVLLSVR